METRRLGGLAVSAICLGTMTFGKDTPRADAFAQMDRALDAGITFLDTAEMYPVNPASAATYGETERIIGDWLARSGARGRVQIATKVSGPNGGHTRGGRGHDGAVIGQAVDDSLRRLRTDRIDLYQLHWPKRDVWAFRDNWSFDPRSSSKARVIDHMADVLAAMAEVVAAGKVREFGLSNETAWGTMRWLAQAEFSGGPRVVSVQNEYSALHRLCDTDLAEVCQKEGVALLAFSPLAAGLLTGKYAGGAIPPGSRAAMDIARGGAGDLGGRRTARAGIAVQAWAALARELGHDPIHMAVAFVRQRPFPTVPIIGATDVRQLDHLVAGLGLRLDADSLSRIDDFHRAHPMPY